MKYHVCLLLFSLAVPLSVARSEDAAPLQPGPKFDYSKFAFQPESWEKHKISPELTPWVGRNVIFLTTSDSFDPALMGIWVSRLDAGWDLFAELTGRKPAPFKQHEGKATIAAVPGYDLTCGAGCGYLGATGIELAMFYDHNYAELKAHPKSMPHYVFYEMGRNFYTFGRRHSCYTTGFAVFMRYVCMDDLKCEDRDLQTRKTIEGLEPLMASSNLSFLDLFAMLHAGEKVSRIRDASGKVVEPSDQPCRYATAMMRLYRENGRNAWLKRFFRELATCPESNPDTESGALSQAWYWLLCSSVAAQKDISPIFAGDWKLPITEATRIALAKIDWKKPGLTVKEVTEAVKPHWQSGSPTVTSPVQVADSIDAALAVRKTAASQSKPNILFILADDLGYMDISANNPKTFYETPNIDALAAKGMRFKQGYAACPVCSPTRASILTGKYPQRVGITDFIGAAQPEKWARPTKLLPAPYNEKLAHEEVTLAEAFKAHGYTTFFAGKWHLGPTNYWPEDQGFDINMGGIDRGGPYGGNKYFSPYDNPRLPDGPPGEHLPDRLASETAKFIEANRDRPFLAYLSFYSVHTPLMAREDLRKKYEAKAKTLPTNAPAWGQERERKVRLVQDHAVYAGMVEAMDQAVGKVLAALDRTGLGERTIVVFMSDNGGLSTSEGHPTSNLPLRAGKGWLYEGGIREPMIIHAPGVTRAGTTCDTPVTSVDFYPTLLELAGLPPLPRQHLDGVSLVPLLKGSALNRGPLFWHYPHYGNQGGSPGGAVRDGDWKLIEWYEGGVELFNLKDDLCEQHDLARQNPAKVKELQVKLDAWRSEVGAKMPVPRPSAANPPAGQQP